jgi:hypothetical protein
MERVELRPFTLEGFHDRRDRKRRNKRITAGVVGIAVFVAAVWIVTSGVWFDRTQTPAVPGGAETGPAVTGPAVPLPSTRVGFIGVPPKEPRRARRWEELVLNYWSSPFRMGADDG